MFKAEPNVPASIPDEIDLDALKAQLTPQEVEALSTGEDPLFAAEPTPDQPAQMTDAAPADRDAAVPQAVPAAAPAAGADVVLPPPPQLPDVDAAKETIAKLDAEIEALQERYDNGEISAAERQAGLRELMQRQAEAQAQIVLADQTRTAYATQVEEAWRAAQTAYHARHPYLWSDEHIAGWDAALRSVTGTPQYARLPLHQQMQIAHAQYAASHAALTGKPLPGAPTIGGTATGTPQMRRDPRPEPPVTLGGLNGDTAQAIHDGTFAHIDRLADQDVIAAERAYAAMDATARERYLASAI